VALTMGTGVFGPKSDARLNIPVEPPTGAVILWDPVPQRIRAIVAGEAVIDSKRAVLLHEGGHLPVYYFPPDDVRQDLLEPSDHATRCPHKGEASYWSIKVGRRVIPNAIWSYQDPLEPVSFIAGYMAPYWHLMDEWFAEEEQLFGHPRDPYHRIDVYPSASTVRVLLDGEVLAESRRAQVLFESGLPPRYYLPAEDVRVDLLVPSSKKTRCAYKGAASYWHAQVGDRLEDDLVWTYRQPQHDAEPVRDLLCFFQERVDLELDGEIGERPQTPWSR
jgi:uncharacterized protein (DUF427 family)